MGTGRTCAKRNTDKAPRGWWRVRRSVATQVHFNCAILKGASRNDGETAGIIQILWTSIGNTHGRAAEVSNWLRFDVVEFELVQGDRRWFLSLLAPRLRPWTNQENGQCKH